jgi:hypothetical protein
MEALSIKFLLASGVSNIEMSERVTEMGEFNFARTRKS